MKPRGTSSALILATLETKAEEVDYLTARLAEHGVEVVTVDVSLKCRGTALGGLAKTAAMAQAADNALAAVTAAMDQGVNAVVGLGGGTGAETIIKVLRAMPITFPKVLVTTLPFDPRYALADNSITLVPTLADLCGLNATLREVLENAAAMTAGLCRTRRRANACVHAPSIGMSAMGVTDGLIDPLVARLRRAGEEVTVFHANGFGGAAFSRFARRGAFHTIIDVTPHELTRMHIAGAHVAMPDRFTAAPAVPRIVLPGALNFIGLGQKALVPPRYLVRQHYEHSGYFTHVQMTPDEMDQVTQHLAAALNACTGERTLIVPMGGFSKHDRPGGAVEGPELREIFLARMRERLSADVRLRVLDAHLFDAAVTDEVMASLKAFATV
ncbi:MAG: Tm-1-like ATP-binding domain-containing protein [Pseudomonadota bacterium]